MTKHISIAIDGPSGSGKSTTAKNVANALKIEYIDTGAMYRAAALQAKRENVPMEDRAVETMMEHTDIDFTGGEIYLNGEKIDALIRNLEISAMASKISQLASCRRKLVDLQRRIAQKKSIVMDGRDIGSNVLPDAEYKFFLTASLDIRAERRLKELLEKGTETTLESVREDLSKRDYDDIHRDLNPLVKAEDAIEISTDIHSIEEMTALILSYVK